MALVREVTMYPGEVRLVDFDFKEYHGALLLAGQTPIVSYAAPLSIPTPPATGLSDSKVTILVGLGTAAYPGGVYEARIKVANVLGEDLTGVIRIKVKALPTGDPLGYDMLATQDRDERLFYYMEFMAKLRGEESMTSEGDYLTSSAVVTCDSRVVQDGAPTVGGTLVGQKLVSAFAGLVGGSPFIKRVPSGGPFWVRVQANTYRGQVLIRTLGISFT